MRVAMAESEMADLGDLMIGTVPPLEFDLKVHEVGERRPTGENTAETTIQIEGTTISAGGHDHIVGVLPQGGNTSQGAPTAADASRSRHAANETHASPPPHEGSARDASADRQGDLDREQGPPDRPP